MTPEQVDQFNQMHKALLAISEGYESSENLRTNAEKKYGMNETDVLELSYGAIQAIAKNAVMGIKKIELTKPQIQQ